MNRHTKYQRGWHLGTHHTLRHYQNLRAAFLAYLDWLPLQADFFRYRERGKLQSDYQAAVFVAACEARESWTKAITGKPGQPAKVAPYYPEETDPVYAAHMKHSFRLWLTRELGRAKDSYRWAYAGEEPHASSLEPHWDGSEGGAEMLSAYSDAKPIGPLETIADRSILGMDPAAFLLLTTRNLEVVIAYLRVRNRFTYPGPTPVVPPLAPEHASAVDKLRREFGWVGSFTPRGSQPSHVLNARGKRIAWTKVNPLLTRRERGQIKHEIRRAARGPYIPDPTGEGWRHPSTEVGDVREANLSWEYEPLRFRTSGLLNKGEVLEWRLRGKIRAYKQPKTAHARRLQAENEPASWSKMGARCPNCDAFVTKSEALEYHDCIQYLVSTKGLPVAVIEQIREAVRAENQPVLDKIEELFGVVIALHGHPAEAAEEILTNSEQDEAA